MKKPDLSGLTMSRVELINQNVYTAKVVTALCKPAELPHFFAKLLHNYLIITAPVLHNYIITASYFPAELYQVPEFVIMTLDVMKNSTTSQVVI